MFTGLEIEMVNQGLVCSKDEWRDSGLLMNLRLR